jgi:hypothetical protein
MPEPHLRAGDADRAAVAARLGEHMTAGRLTVAEYEERLVAAYAATTYGELARLTADLPARGGHTAAVGRREHATRTGGPTAWPCGTGVRRPSSGHASGGHPGAWGSRAWHSWASTAVIVLTIWAVTSLASWEVLYFWPVWVIGPWGAVLLAQRLTGRDAHHRTRSDVRS